MALNEEIMRGKAGPTPKSQTVVEELVSRVGASNERLAVCLRDVRGFILRVSGQEVAPPQSETATDTPQGHLAVLDRMMTERAVTLEELHEAILVLEKIG